MSIPPQLPAVLQTSVGARRQDTPAKIKEAAAQFEALLINQMLQSARAARGTTVGGDSDAEADDASSSLLELGEQQLSQALASSGGLGIAKMVMAGLKPNANR